MVNEPLVSVQNVRKYFPVQRSFFARIFSRQLDYVKAVDGISFQVRKGERFGLVGESGSGKTTTGQLLVGLLEPTDGRILFDGAEMTELQGEELRKMRRKTHMIFQDPASALQPRMRIGPAVTEPLRIHHEGQPQERRARTLDMLGKVGLTPAETFYSRYPHELSGGQKQRVVIARALILRPELVVADEPIAMVDVSVRAQILELMMNLKSEFSLTYVFITHDLSAASYICDKIAVMYLGKIVELAPREELFDNPQHPYTKALISAVPVPDPEERRGEIMPRGEIPNPINPPSGCRFHPRCPYAIGTCSSQEPVLMEISPEHYVACPVLPFR